LPATILELVDAYVKSVLLTRSSDVARLVRLAAIAYLGKELEPRVRGQPTYSAEGVPVNALEELVTVGLMERNDQDPTNPLYGFVPDPIAELLAAREWHSRVTSGDSRSMIGPG
jgi:hypothetical protein